MIGDKLHLVHEIIICYNLSINLVYNCYYPTGVLRLSGGGSFSYAMNPTIESCDFGAGRGGEQNPLRNFGKDASIG